MVIFRFLSISNKNLLIEQIYSIIMKIFLFLVTKGNFIRDFVHLSIGLSIGLSISPSVCGSGFSKKPQIQENSSKFNKTQQNSTKFTTVENGHVINNMACKFNKTAQRLISIKVVDRIPIFLTERCGSHSMTKPIHSAGL